MNKLYYGDCLTIMQQKIPTGAADLIYLDPPFNSKRNYNMMYKTMTGKPVPEQAEAFCDTWEMDAEKEEALEAIPLLMRQHGINPHYAQFWKIWVNALRDTQPHLLAYLIYMVERLIYMKMVLKPTGSLYLHCDPTASHYIKVMMDGIFQHKNFKSEIVWKRTSSHNSAKRWGPIHDIILYYTRSDRYTWNRVSQPYDEKYVEAFYKQKDEQGRRFQLGDLTGAGIRSGDSGKPWRGVDPTDTSRHWAVPPVPGLTDAEIKSLTTQQRLDRLDEMGLIYWPPKGNIPRFRRYYNPDLGVAAQDVITDIDAISSHSAERLGYPTQKPISLLQRIIEASTNPGDVVFDPFCGCGTTIYAAEKLDRQWIGCDIAILSIKLIRDELTGRHKLVEGTNFELDGIPNSVEAAVELWAKNKSQFQHWIVEHIGGFPSRQMSGDHGVDGRMYFETSDGLKDMVLSVKGGNIKPEDIRSLRGVLERDDTSELAGFLSLRPPSKAMIEEAGRAGMYEYNGVKYERIQMLTIQEILEEKKQFRSPTIMGSFVKEKSKQHGLPYS